MTEASNARFNAEAAEWDRNPTVQTASRLALASLLSWIPQMENKSQTIDALEIGCGTGILSFLVAPYVKSLCAVDAAEGMISAFKAKLESRPDIENLQPVYAMLEDPDDFRIPKLGEEAGARRFDLVLSHLVLHHIECLEDILRTMFGCLKSGGMIALTDFEDCGPQSRRFHPEARMAGVERHGIPRRGIEELIKNAGFVDVRIDTAFKMNKNVEIESGKGMGEDNVESMMFPFLICMGRKPRDPPTMLNDGSCQ